MRIRNLTFTLPTQPWLRTLVVIAGVLLIVALATVGLVFGLAALAIGAIAMLVRRWLHRADARQPDPAIIDGEFTVLPPRPRDPQARTE